jgi:hypothetical protein
MNVELRNFERPIIYRIELQGLLKEKWAVWLNSKVLSFDNETSHTAITVAVPDQAVLRGILNKLWDLNLTLISVTQELEENNE